MKFLKNGTIKFDNPPSLLSYASVVGKKEGEGPLGKFFDIIEEDEYCGQDSWEKAESTLIKKSSNLAISKLNLKKEDMDFIVAGDLLNQCTSSGYAVRDLEIPFLGIFGACSTMAESLCVGSLLAEDCAKHVLCTTSSHFCSAEKQFRMPLEYGSLRTPTSQWTVTGSGSVVLVPHQTPPYIESVTIGRIIDLGIKDANNMGAAMAPAFSDTVIRHLKATGRKIDYYDLIVSGDLGIVGKEIAIDLLKRDGIILKDNYIDCGAEIFDKETQDTHAGGSGCGCAASVLCAYILPKIKSGELKKVLFCATGALMSPTLSMQGESIPSISHAVSIEA